MLRTYMGEQTYTDTQHCGRVLVPCCEETCTGEDCKEQLCDKPARFKTFYGARLCAEHWDEHMSDKHNVTMESRAE